eukprot:1138793-Pelagomonas_calceolata.AAC.3
MERNWKRQMRSERLESVDWHVQLDIAAEAIQQCQTAIRPSPVPTPCPAEQPGMCLPPCHAHSFKKEMKGRKNCRQGEGLEVCKSLPPQSYKSVRANGDLEGCWSAWLQDLAVGNVIFLDSTYIGNKVTMGFDLQPGSLAARSAQLFQLHKKCP